MLSSEETLLRLNETAAAWKTFQIKHSKSENKQIG